jgi:hypothetical protein
MLPTYFCHVSFMKMLITCLWKSIVFIQYLESDIVEKESISIKETLISLSQANPKLWSQWRVFISYCKIVLDCDELLLLDFFTYYNYTTTLTLNFDYIYSLDVSLRIGKQPRIPNKGLWRTAHNFPYEFGHNFDPV